MKSTAYYAKISWKESIPISTNYADVYYSTTSGLNESDYIFLTHNKLAERFARLKDNAHFVIAETGFGSGLNFLATLKLWYATVTTQAKLFFISFEKHPLKPQDIQSILNNFPELDKHELLDQYYLPLQATHRLHFKHNVYLNLVIGDINDTLINQSFNADAWYLDGFTPTRNPDMWNTKIIEQISLHSQPGTTFATFTASSMVRQLLLQYGFAVSKDQGYSKREMLHGTYIQSPQQSYVKPWFSLPPKYTETVKKVIIIGCGISGASAAYSLARRGYKVIVYESAKTLNSGNDQLVLYGNFSGNNIPSLELSYAGYRYSHHLIKSLLVNNVDYQNCGVIQLAHNPAQLKQHRQILYSNIPNDFCYALNKEQITALAGIEINCQSGLYYPYGLWLNPFRLIQQLISHPNITLILDSKITHIKHINEKWQIHSHSSIVDSAPHLVLCNSHQLSQFTQTSSLPLIKTRGQTTKVKSNLGLKAIICANSYITPNHGNQYTIGATFKRDDIGCDIRAIEHQENIAAMSSLIPHLEIEPSLLTGYANIRASCSDYLPMVGPVAEYNQFKLAYHKLAKDAKIKLDTPCPYLPGLYVNTGHGSKGMLSAPICGEIIADYIDNTPFAISVQLRQALHPNRFWVKTISQTSSTS